ncbi:MAG TPA: hypothetical protein ENN41_10995 [Sediminispirochaeta sp.]|nr:hypothetical protein [Sediminispirochaeta sp.]
MKILSRQKRRSALLALIVLAVGLLASCATHEVGVVKDPPGFFHGLLHGFLIMFSFIGSLFTDYEIYAIPNSGPWYDLGYLLGASVFLGGSGSKARKC